MSDTDTNIPKVPKSPAWILDETNTPSLSRPQQTPSSVPEIASVTRGATALAPVIGIDRLYDAVPGTSSTMVRALELLKQASDDLVTARKTENPMDASRLVPRVQLILPKLFACRSIGDGFGVVINSVHFAFTNLRGTPLTPNQLNAVWRVLRELRDRPAMSLEQGIQRVEELEGKVWKSTHRILGN